MVYTIFNKSALKISLFTFFFLRMDPTCHTTWCQEAGRGGYDNKASTRRNKSCHAWRVDGMCLCLCLCVKSLYNWQFKEEEKKRWEHQLTHSTIIIVFSTALPSHQHGPNQFEELPKRSWSMQAMASPNVQHKQWLKKANEWRVQLFVAQWHIHSQDLDLLHTNKRISKVGVNRKRVIYHITPYWFKSKF